MRREPFPKMLAAWVAQRAKARARRIRLGLEGYAYVYGILAQGPCTRLQLQLQADIGHVGAIRFLHTARAMGEVHVSGWETPPKRAPRPIFSLGPGIDAPPPPMARGQTRKVPADRLRKHPLCPALVHFFALKRALEAASSRDEVREATGLHHATVARVLDLLAALDLAHLCEWLPREQGGPPIPLYVWGPGANKRRPVFTAARRRQRSNASARALRQANKALELGQAIGVLSGRVALGESRAAA